MLARLLAVLPGAGRGPALQRHPAGRRGRDPHRPRRPTQSSSVVPSVGNIATEMRVKGHNVLRYPHASLADFKARPGPTGIPFMGPWANRLDEPAFYANGRRHAFDMTLGNIRGEVPIHGFVTDHRPVAGHARSRRRPTRRRHEPSRVLPAAGVDAAMAVRAHGRDHLSPGRRRARGGDRRREPERRADAGGHRLPSLLPAHRLAPRRVAVASRRQDALVDPRRAQAAHRRRPSPPSGCCRRRASACATTASTKCSATWCATPRAARR